MTDKDKNAVATIQDGVTFNLPALVNPDEAREIMQENLGEIGGSLRFDKVKIPSGGGIAFTVIDENGEESPTKTLTGVVVDHYPVNAYWHDKFTGENNPPDCASIDGKTGKLGEETKYPPVADGQSCAACPLNQFKSDPTGGKGKACKNMIRLYLIPEGSMFPVLVTLPPTSIGNWKDYVKRLTDKSKLYYGVVTSIKLVKDKNAGGIEYAKAEFAKAADLTPQERVAIKTYKATLASFMRSVPVEATEYNVEGGSGAGNGGTAAGVDEDQPF